MRFRHVASGLMAAALAASAGSCATNPVTGERQLSLISEAQETEMGQQASQEVEASIGLVEDAGLQSYVSRVGTALAARSERPQLPWRFGVVDDPTPNAFALPGGFIYVTRGLMTLMESEAELATVLGHEIGHVTARHSVTMLSRAQLAQLGLGIGMVLVPELQGLGNLAGTGLQLLFLKYGRDAEHQADELGFRYALGQAYDVREMADVFRTLERASQAEGQSPLPTWLSTHPYPAERIQRTNERIAALQPPPTGGTVRRAEYLNEIDGVVYGENPRNGFFRGTTFLHPDLRFRLDFPQGWRTQNLPQAVMAGSPQQDAAIQLTLAQGTPESAAREFLGQQGIQSTAPRSRSVNGLPAVSAQFRAQTEQGMLEGIALFVAHGGNTYMLLGFTPSQRFGAYQGALEQSLGSFAVLTDPQALNVRPNRVTIVRTQQSTTLAEFNRRYPSVIELAELALINQVADGNTTIPSGTMVKRVVAG
jgi:predicted Zn-dependent protease